MDIKKELEKNLDSMISHMQGLIRIPSIAGEAEGDYPFGREVQRALDYMLNLGESMGFEVKNVDNYGAHIDFPGTGEGIMAIVGHIDVVPEGEGWTYGPFDGNVVDGWMYGRGTQDDKCPTIIGLYAMKILKDLGFKPQKTIRLILGLDEEANWDGMKYYLEKEKAPDFGIVPDADFPLVQCEKGLLEFDIVKGNSKFSAALGTKGLLLESITGGSAPNVVAGHAVIQIAGDRNEIAETEKRINEKAVEKNYEIKTWIENEKLMVKTIGITAHASYPERGKNAISMAMDLLGEIGFENDDANTLMKFYNEQIGFALDGSKIGCAMADDLSGNLTFNVGKISFDEAGTKLTIDIRYPVTESQESVFSGIRPIAEKSGFHLELLDHIKAIYQESDHPVVVTLVEVYREISGDTETQPTAIGGATFARAIPNCMAFGPLFPGDPELEHQKDEKSQISQMLKAGHIYAEAIRRLAGN